MLQRRGFFANLKTDKTFVERGDVCAVDSNMLGGEVEEVGVAEEIACIVLMEDRGYRS